MPINTLCVFGTRPEAIKMAPLVKRLEAHSSFINQVCVTGQHLQMLDSVLRLFEIIPDFDLKVMTTNQSLTSLTSKILYGVSALFDQKKPDLVLVHGDTTTTFVASLAAFYHQIPIAHIEAGLRTNNLYSPWPEEANRKLTSVLTSLHFAPTARARDNLLNEGIAPNLIHVTGNTVIDALHIASYKLETQRDLALKYRSEFPFLNNPGQRMLLVTGHRRENFGEGIENICQALLLLAQRFPELIIVYVLHLNPNVQEPVTAKLNSVNNIYLVEPVSYLPFVYLMKHADIILTDSGGIQEEAPALGKPVLVTRERTERPEAVLAGTVKLVGSHVDRIVAGVTELLENASLYKSMSEAQNPYGDGRAVERIIEVIQKRFVPPKRVEFKKDREASFA